MTPGLRANRAVVVAILCLVAATTIYPLVFMGLTAFRQRGDYLLNPYGWPAEFTLHNIVVLIENYDVVGAALNSTIVVAVAATISVSLATLAAFALTKLELPGRAWIGAGFLSVMLMPSQVLIIPVYLMLASAGLVDTLAGVIAVFVATTIPFGVFFMSVMLRGVPNELIEAAWMDGAGHLRTLVSVVAPAARSGILTLVVLTFLTMWNELLFGYILLPSESQQLLTPKMAYLGGRFVTNQPVLMAGLLITSLPPILVLAFMSRHLVNGITEGAIK